MSAARNHELEVMCREHFNEPVLLDFDLARVIGYGESAVDCYILCRKPNPDSETIHWQTCVGGYTFLALLKEQGKVTSTEGEEWSDFTRLDTVLGFNGSPKEQEFILKLEHADLEGMPPRRRKPDNAEGGT